MSWTKYRERRQSQSSEVSLNDSKDSSISEENNSGENVRGHRSRNSNNGRWSDDPELLGRRAGRKTTNCVPFLVDLIHSRDQSPVVRDGASGALREIIESLDDKKGREQHVLELLEELRDYCEMLKMVVNAGFVPENPKKHPNSTMTTVMKLSFHENYHRTICYLGGLQTIAELIECEHAAHGSETNERDCIALRRDSGMTLASLIIGDSTNKVLLCSFRDFLKVWVKQLFSSCEELRQVTASVFSNLSWRAENESKQALREAGVVGGMMKAAMLCRKENCLKIILSALWNLSAHCAANKAEICEVEGALSFLVNTLCYESPSKGLAIAENAGGIIRNVSSHIAVREDYRAILRQKDCIKILIRHLKSPSLTVISNACGTLWNLSAWCPQDQKTLWELGAIPLLRNLASSKHKMISTGANAALRNLLTAKGANGNVNQENKVRKPQPPEEDNSSMVPRKRDSLGTRAQVDLDVSKGGCVKKNLFAESIYRYERGFAPIGSRSTYSSQDRTVIKQRSIPTAYISTEPGKKLKFCIRLTSETYEYRETKESFRSSTDVPWNSPPDLPSFTQPRVCSPVEENHDEASACAEESNSSFEKPYQNFINRSSSDSACDEDINDQPVDYSKKYSERNPSQNNLLESQDERSSKKEFSDHDHEDKVDLFGDYVETDLDQPTDYSLRYAEDDTDEDEKSNPEYFPRNEQEDTVKTYCTEGTPYQTPFNFSTATSMSDLRVEDPKEGEVVKKFSKKMDLRSKNSDPVSKDLQFDESKETEEGERLLSTDVNLTEKPVSYCVEGTPGCFSRVSSLSSLGSALITQNVSIEVVSEEVGADLGCHPLEREGTSVEESNQKRGSASGEREKNESRIVDKEGKAVTFRREDHYAEQTPLMFSRCSSLGSLSGFEQHSIRDDLSSGISDFSRMTSGVVSPSELPDSPTQTVPPSPRHHKHPASEFGRKSQAEGRHSFQNQSFSKMQSAKRSVFEDEMSAFKDESTPLEFSAATSLSSLTIDDEPKLPRDLQFRLIEKRPIVPESEESENSVPQSGNGHLSDTEREDIDDLHQSNEDTETDRYSHTSNPQKSTTLSQPSNLRRFETSFTLDRLDPAAVSARVGLISASDSVHVYCTEDTPDGSISNLSALSMPSIPDDNESNDNNKLLDLSRFKSSDEGSNSSGDNEILEERVESENTKDQSNPQSPRDLRQNTSLDVPSDDSVSLTEEENNKLDQLIESAMPKRCLNDTTSPTTSELNLQRASPAPSEGGNSFLEEESNKENQLIESSSVPTSPKGSLKNRSSSSLQKDCKIESPSPVPSEEELKVYSLMESEMEGIPLNVPSSTPNSPSSPRSPSPENITAFYRTNPCGRSSTPTTLVQKTGKDSPSPVQSPIPSPVPSEDRVSLTEEENIKLDQLIESAMPKRQNALSSSPPTSPELLINKSNYNSPSRRLHSSSQSEILSRDLNNDFTEEDNRIDQLSESGGPKKRLSVSSRSSPVNIRGRSDPYSDAPLPPLRQQSFKPRVTRESMSDFAFSQEENLRLEQLIQLGKKSVNHSVKSSPIKVQDNRPNKNSYVRPSYNNSMRQNFFRSDRINPEPEYDTISMTEEDNFKLDQLIESAMPKKQTQSFHRNSSGRVLEDIPANRMLPYGCSSPPLSPQQNIIRTGRIKSEQNENRHSLTIEENLRLDQLIESAMPKKRVNSSLKPTSSKVPVDTISHRSNTCIRSSNPSLRRHSYGNVGKWKYYKRLGFSRILRFIRENYP